jgi:two-component system CheB/CheR fusion protein
MALDDLLVSYVSFYVFFADLNGQPIETHIGRTLQEMIPSLSEKMERPIAEVFDRATSVANLEASVRLDGESVRDFLVDLYPYEEDGLVTAVGIVLKDVTELRQLEKELRRLMDELQHRVKNTLATVASIVNQTVSGNADRLDLIDTLKMRIGALAATHNLLTLRNWRDASLQEILRAELTPFDHEDRIKLSGPPVMLPPKHALTLTLTLHELATNAAKYGALAQDNGILEIDWSVNVDSAGRELTLHWREDGVSDIKLEGVKESFGTRLIKNAVVHDLQGRCDHRLLPGGLSCTIVVPF